MAPPENMSTGKAQSENELFGKALPEMASRGKAVSTEKAEYLDKSEKVEYLTLWRDYLFLTTEMKRCLQRKDADLYLNLLEQRECLQGRIDTHHSKVGPAEKAIIRRIVAENEVIGTLVRLWVNDGRHRIEIKDAYDGWGGGYAGSRINWQG